jgi:hypothetical protein
LAPYVTVDTSTINDLAGPNDRYNFGVGLIVGGSSRLGNDGASVSGGFLNSAGGLFSTVAAGLRKRGERGFLERGRRRR